MCHFLKTGVNHTIDAVRRIIALGIGLTRLDTGKQAQCLISGFHRIDMELIRLHRFDHIRMLLAGQPTCAADFEEALNFLIHSANGLYLPVLID